MSQKIHILSRQLANQIAAWEVVERPLSVVKELVENSLDAGATEITVRLEEWGCKLIEVRDNGSGISPEDMKIVLEKYSTSKISNIQDLYNVASFGFRGEALASISSVSEFTLISKTVENIAATKIFTQGWEEIEFSEVSGDIGTTITVENLFFNTPARLSYLKKARTEYSKIYDFLWKMSFAYPEVHFQLFHDGKQIFSFPPIKKPSSRIYEIFWNDVYENLLEVSYEFDGMSCTWYITDPKISFPNKNRQVIFVNQRLITSPIVAKAISDAYNRFIPHGTSPSYVLFLSLDPTQVDVNVHPRKMELRFAAEQSVFRSVYHGVKNTLEKVSLIEDQSHRNSSHNLSPESPHTNSFTKREDTNHRSQSSQQTQYYTGSGTKFKNYSPYKNTQANPAQHAIDFSAEILWNSQGNISWGESENFIWYNDSPLWKIIGQVHNSYIVVETPDGIKILDQHALAERVIYEKLASSAYSPKSQGVIWGIWVQVSSIEYEKFENNSEVFFGMGFEIEAFPGNILMVYSVPDFLKKENIEKTLQKILSDMSSIGSKSLDEIRHKIWAYTACRSAVKFWDPLSMQEMQQLLIDASLDYSATCPHGRPVVWEMSLDELQKKYER